MPTDPYSWTTGTEEDDDLYDWGAPPQDNGKTALAETPKTPGDITGAAGLGDDVGPGDLGDAGLGDPLGDIGGTFDPQGPGDMGGSGGIYDTGFRKGPHDEEFDVNDISEMSIAQIHAMADAGNFSQKFADAALQIKHERDEQGIVLESTPRKPYVPKTPQRPGSVFSYESRYNAPGRPDYDPASGTIPEVWEEAQQVIEWSYTFMRGLGVREGVGAQSDTYTWNGEPITFVSGAMDVGGGETMQLAEILQAVDMRDGLVSEAWQIKLWSQQEQAAMAGEAGDFALNAQKDAIRRQYDDYRKTFDQTVLDEQRAHEEELRVAQHARGLSASAKERMEIEHGYTQGLDLQRSQDALAELAQRQKNALIRLEAEQEDDMARISREGEVLMERFRLEHESRGLLMEREFEMRYEIEQLEQQFAAEQAALNRALEAEQLAEMRRASQVMEGIRHQENILRAREQKLNTFNLISQNPAMLYFAGQSGLLAQLGDVMGDGGAAIQAIMDNVNASAAVTNLQEFARMSGTEQGVEAFRLSAQTGVISRDLPGYLRGFAPTPILNPVPLTSPVTAGSPLAGGGDFFTQLVGG